MVELSNRLVTKARTKIAAASCIGQGSGDNSQLTKLIITAASELIDMQRETEILVQNNPEVSDRVEEGDMRERFSHKTKSTHSQMN